MNKQWIFLGISSILLHQVSANEQDVFHQEQQVVFPSGEYIPDAEERERSLRYFDEQIQRRSERSHQDTDAFGRRKRMMEDLQREQKAKRELEEKDREQERLKEKSEEKMRRESRRQEILREEEVRRNAR